MTVRNYTLLQGVLRSGINLAKVVDKYKLKVNRSKRHPNLVQFKYDQIDSDMSDTLVQQCRGIILDEKGNWEIIARPFDKFFNAGEIHAAKIDWKTARVLEKLDGTCCFLYYYDGWQVATLGSADASGPVGAMNMTFADLFWATFHDKGYKVPDPMWQGVTFIFELMTPYNRVVVDHVVPDLKLLGARISTGEESATVNGGRSSPTNPAGYEIVQSFSLSNLKEIEESFANIDPTQQEGYVVVDGKYNRIKVKHPGYVRIHHLKDSFTLRNIVNCVRMGEAVEFINYFPEHKGALTTIQDSFFNLVEDISDVWHLVESRGVLTDKEFAAEVNEFPFSGVLFAVRKGKKDSIVHALQEMHIDSLIGLLRVPEQKVA